LEDGGERVSSKAELMRELLFNNGRGKKMECLHSNLLLSRKQWAAPLVSEERTYNVEKLPFSDRLVLGEQKAV
jgi:hypothetical protein